MSDYIDRVISEAATAGEACDARVRDQQATCAEQLATAAANCAEQLAPLTARISQLEASSADLVEVVQASEAELRRWQIWTYVGGGAALSAIAFLAVR